MSASSVLIPCSARPALNAVAAAIGGFAPLLAALLVGWIGWPGASLLYMTAAVVGLIGILVTRETYGRSERARINALVAEEKRQLV